MAVFKDDVRLDNIFKEIMSDKEFCELFPVEPGEYKNLAQGKASKNKLIVALATAIRDIDSTILSHHKNGNQWNKEDGVDHLGKDEMKTIYRKIAYMFS